MLEFRQVRALFIIGERIYNRRGSTIDCVRVFRLRIPEVGSRAIKMVNVLGVCEIKRNALKGPAPQKIRNLLKLMFVEH